MNKQRLANSKWFHRLFYFIVGLVNGTLGSGGGTVLIPFLNYKHKLSGKTAHATTLAAILPLSAISGAIYLKNISFAPDVFWKTVIGTSIGAAAGAMFLKKISTIWLKRIFGLLMLITSLRMFFA